MDLKGAFESVDHCSTTYFINKFSPKLAKITKSYLTNRIATIYNQNYPDDTPRLKYMPNRSVPQGSKVSPLLFSIATGLALKWFKHRLIGLTTGTDNKIEVVAYADDVAITISCPNIMEIPPTATKVAHIFKNIMNIFGGNLEPSKTEILANDAIANKLKEINIVETNIKLDTRTSSGSASTSV